MLFSKRITVHPYQFPHQKRAELQSLSFTIRFLSDRFAIEKEPVAQNLGFPCSTPVYLNLLRKKADLKRHLSSQEKQNLNDKIASIINDKRVYSLEKCKQAMFEHERYGVYEYGDINMIDKITPQGLYRFYQKLINSAALFISYAGFERDTSGLLKPLCDKFEVQKRPLPKTTVINEVSGIKEVTGRNERRSEQAQSRFQARQSGTGRSVCNKDVQCNIRLQSHVKAVHERARKAVAVLLLLKHM